MKLKVKFLLPIVLLAGSLTACDNNPAPQVAAPAAPVPAQVDQQPQVVYEEAPQQQPQVVVVEQQPQVVYRDSHSSGITAGHVASGILGYMAGKHFSGNRGSSYSSRKEVHHYYHSAPRRSRSYFGSRGRRR